MVTLYFSLPVGPPFMPNDGHGSGAESHGFHAIPASPLLVLYIFFGLKVLIFVLHSSFFLLPVLSDCNLCAHDTQIRFILPLISVATMGDDSKSSLIRRRETVFASNNQDTPLKRVFREVEPSGRPKLRRMIPVSSEPSFSH